MNNTCKCKEPNIWEDDNPKEYCHTCGLPLPSSAENKCCKMCISDGGRGCFMNDCPWCHSVSASETEKCPHCEYTPCINTLAGTEVCAPNPKEYGIGYCLRCGLETQPRMLCKCSFRDPKEPSWATKTYFYEFDIPELPRQYPKTPKGSNNWKGEKATVQAKHAYLRKNYGPASKCENPGCLGECKWYDWALKRGRDYSHNPDDYFHLCRRCHRMYDMTVELREKAIKNLPWAGGKSDLKLNAELVAEIREQLNSGVRMSVLIKKYKLGEITVARIRDNLIWKV